MDSDDRARAVREAVAAHTVRERREPTGVTAAVEMVRGQIPAGIGGVIAGVQAALLSLALVLIPVWVMVTAQPSSQVTWGQSSGLAARVWLMGFGIAWSVDGVPITLIPWGIAAVTVAMIAQLVRRFAPRSAVGAGTAVLTFSLLVALIASLAWSASPHAPTTALKAGAVAFVLALAPAWWQTGAAESHVRSLLVRVPVAIKGVTMTAAAMVAATTVIAAATVVISAVARRQDVADAATRLALDGASGTALAALETVYAPNLVVWTAAFISGAGFGSQDHLVVPTGGVDGLPSLPMLATLPLGAGGAPWAPWLLVVAGGVAMFITANVLPKSWWAVALPVGAGAAAGGVFAFAATLTRGGIGPGNLAHVGADPAASGLLIGLWLALGAAAAVGILRVVEALRPAQGPRTTGSVPVRRHHQEDRPTDSDRAPLGQTSRIPQPDSLDRTSAERWE